MSRASHRSDDADFDALVDELIMDEKSRKEFRKLVPALRIVERSTEGPLDARRRFFLAQRIMVTIGVYHGTQLMDMLSRKQNIDEIAKPLAEVIEKLQEKANIDVVLVALGAPAMLIASPDQDAFQKAIAEYQIILRGLRKIAANMPASAAKRGRGRPRALDLHALVERLAQVWNTFTGKPFKQLWHRQRGVYEPLTESVQFIHSIVEIVDAKRLKELPTITKRIVAELNPSSRTRRRSAS